MREPLFLLSVYFLIIGNLYLLDLFLPIFLSSYEVPYVP